MLEATAVIPAILAVLKVASLPLFAGTLAMAFVARWFKMPAHRGLFLVAAGAGAATVMAYWLTSITCTQQRQLHRPIGLVV